MSEHGKHEKEDDGPDRAGEGLSALAADAAHPFDQTNGIVEGLEGDADDPDKVDERLAAEPRAAEEDHG
jgi:hypothetical protein